MSLTLKNFKFKFQRENTINVDSERYFFEIKIRASDEASLES